MFFLMLLAYSTGSWLTYADAEPLCHADVVHAEESSMVSSTLCCAYDCHPASQPAAVVGADVVAIQQH